MRGPGCICVDLCPSWLWLLSTSSQRGCLQASKSPVCSAFWYSSYYSKIPFSVLNISTGVSLGGAVLGDLHDTWDRAHPFYQARRNISLSVLWDTVPGEGNMILCLVSASEPLELEPEPAHCGTGCALNLSAASTHLCPAPHTHTHSIYRWQNQRASSLSYNFGA